MSKGWKLKDENWNVKSNHVHELTKRRHAGSWVSLIPCKISTDQLWPPAMTPTYWVCHPGASCRYVFTTWGECLRWHKTHQRFLCPLLCIKLKNIHKVGKKNSKISAPRLERVTESEELFGTELDTHRKARSRPCVIFYVEKTKKRQNPSSIDITGAAVLTAWNQLCLNCLLYRTRWQSAWENPFFTYSWRSWLRSSLTKCFG